MSLLELYLCSCATTLQGTQKGVKMIASKYLVVGGMKVVILSGIIEGKDKF